MQPEIALATRICHDLITPLNAINLGLESLEISKDEFILESLQESTNKANALLKFIRELFSEKGQGFYYSSLNLNKSISEYLGLYKINFKLTSDVESISTIFGKLIMFTGIVIKECMPLGGEISCVLDTQMNKISVRYKGTNIVEILKKDITEEELTHKTIFKYFWQKMLEDANFVWKTTNNVDAVFLYLQCNRQ